MNADQIIAETIRVCTGNSGAAEITAVFVASRLREAGIDLDHTYADTGINTLNGVSMTLAHIERNEPLFVRRPLEGS